MIRGPPSIGFPLPSSILPNRSLETANLTVSPMKRTLVEETSRPEVPSKTCTTAKSLRTSNTCPLLSSPAGVRIRTSSPNPTPFTFWTQSRGPEISLTVEYSLTTTDTLLPPLMSLDGWLLKKFSGQGLELLFHIRFDVLR